VETIRKKNLSSLPPNLNSKKPNNIARYSGLAFELLGILVVGIGGGYGLDVFLGNDIPFLTLIFSLLSLVAVIFYLWKRLLKD